MARRLSFIPPGSTVEVVDKTINDLLLLRPSPELTAIFLGILGKALAEFEVLLHGFVVMSNHIHMLLTVADAGTLARFMNFFKSKLAKEVGRLHDWHGPVFAGRYKRIVVADDAATVGRMGYIMAHGSKEGLVSDPMLWPGASSLPGLVDGEALRGTYYDRSAYSKARSRGRDVKLEDFATEYEVPLSKIPCWADLSDEEYQTRCRQLLADVREDLKEQFRREGTRPMGPRAVCRQHPHSRPRDPKRNTPAPLCHASSAASRSRFRKAYGAFAAAYREASARLHAGERDVRFPPYSFPAPGAFVVPEALPP